MSDHPDQTAEHPDLIAALICVAAMEIRKIVDPDRRAVVARNAAAALEETINGE